MTDIINILLYSEFVYHFKHGLICNSKQYYAMFKITKGENCVVYLQFALIATSKLKPGKILKVMFAWIKVVPALHFLC